MAAERVNYPFAWPHQWTQVEAAPNWLTVDLSSMRFADVKTPIAHHPTVSAEWYLPDHAYGNTETFTISTIFEANTPREVHANSWGVALPGVTVKIVDPLTAGVIPRGQSGEICVKGPTLMLGYIGTPLDETLDAEGFFRTGDSGYLDEAGRLFWEGRLTDIIKTGGANVSPLEVDEVLAKHCGVKVTKTVGLPHETLGEVVVACVVPHDGASLQAEEIRGYLARTAGELQSSAPRAFLPPRRHRADRQRQNQVRRASRIGREAIIGIGRSTKHLTHRACRTGRGSCA